jgi:alpha-beta hydrolase superfamily lysophospholipase
MGAKQTGEEARGRAVTISAAGEDHPALYFPAGGGRAVLMAPGASYDRESWRPLAEELAGRGMAALSLDDGSPELVLAALEWLGERGHSRVALLGASAGGAGLLRTLDRMGDPGPVERVALLAPAGGPPVSQAIPKLFVGAEEDPIVPARRVRRVQGESSEPKELKIFSGEGHAQALLRGPHADQARRLVVEFLTQP